MHANGLMYSDTTMKQLAFIVDSLNIKFRSCALSKTYYSKYQTKAHFIKLEEGDIKEAKKDMENNISFGDFMKKYPTLESDKDLLVVKFKYEDYKHQKVVEYSSMLKEHIIRIKDNPELYVQAVKGKWVFDYWAGGEYSGESLRAFYFVDEFERKPLQEAYARMVQYADCMVDTSTQIFRAEGAGMGKKRFSKVTKFMLYVNRESNKPKYDEKNDTQYWKEYRAWDSLKMSFVDSVLSKRKKFIALLSEAVEEALEHGGSDDEFEQYVGRYYSMEAELALKRSRIVYGACSMDRRPRVHAMNIAVLSAETVNWEIFLRAHLDIMNDRFKRASDGSYAWAVRQTYIKELEELDINVADLLFGISLRIENPSKNHYFGSIGRLGRALAETKYADEIEARMLVMLQDGQLDDYNRILMYYLFLNYNHYLEDAIRKQKNVEKLRMAVKGLPEYLAIRIESEEAKE